MLAGEGTRLLASGVTDVSARGTAQRDRTAHERAQGTGEGSRGQGGGQARRDGGGCSDADAFHDQLGPEQLGPTLYARGRECPGEPVRGAVHNTGTGGRLHSDLSCS
jgi:hypothetical protein